MNTRFTVESATHIAVFELVPYGQKKKDVAANTTITMPAGTKADYEAARERQRELIEAFGFGIYFDLICDDDDNHFFCFTTNPGNSDAVLMSLAKKL